MKYNDLLIARHKYFIDGISVAHQLMIGYTGERRLYYSDKKEFRENLKMGFVFFVGTCLIDWGISIM